MILAQMRYAWFLHLDGPELGHLDNTQYALPLVDLSQKVYTICDRRCYDEKHYYHSNI